MSDEKKVPRWKRLIAIAFLRLVAKLSLPAAHALGAALGTLAGLFPSRGKATAQTNIDLCFPDATPAWRAALLQEHLREVGKAFTETPGIWMNPGEKYLAMVRKVDGGELLDAARASGDGVLLLCPHLGSWEIAANWCTSRFPVTGLYRPARYPEIDEIMRRGREQYQGTAVPTDASGVRQMVKTLATGGVLFILPDQEPLWAGGEFAPFFGVPALTGVLTARLANGKRPIRTLMITAKRLPRGAGWDILIREPDPALRSDDTATALAALNRSVENLVREFPAQWAWTYKRFKRRPDGHPPVYRR